MHTDPNQNPVQTRHTGAMRSSLWSRFQGARRKNTLSRGRHHLLRRGFGDNRQIQAGSNHFVCLWGVAKIFRTADNGSARRS